MNLPFARLALTGYLLYGFGYVVPLLRRDLVLSESMAGLHASAIAAGIILSGVVGERFVLRAGAGLAARLAAGGLGLASLVVAFAPHVAASLAAALLLGACAGVLLSWVNQRLSSLGGHRASVALARANLIALVAALIAPLAIAAIDEMGLGGRLALLLPIPLVGLVELANWRIAGGGAPTNDPAPEAFASGRLPGAYWRAWLVLVLVVAIEFSVVFWGSSLVAVRTGAGTAQATTAAAAFLLGMIVGRATISFGIGAGFTRTRLMTLALGLVVLGIVGAWQATSVALSAGALFIAGLGVGPLYPIGVAFSLSLVRAAPEAAAARATLASGVAILVAPFVLAVTAERIGLVNAWPLIGAVALVSIALLFMAREDSSPA